MMMCCFIMTIRVDENSMILGIAQRCFRSQFMSYIYIQDAAISLIIIKCVVVVQSMEQIP